MFRGPSYGGRSKATPSTTCQKCLKKDMPPNSPLVRLSLTFPNATTATSARPLHRSVRT